MISAMFMFVTTNLVVRFLAVRFITNAYYDMLKEQYSKRRSGPSPDDFVQMKEFVRKSASKIADLSSVAVTLLAILRYGI